MKRVNTEEAERLLKERIGGPEYPGIGKSHFVIHSDQGFFKKTGWMIGGLEEALNSWDSFMIKLRKL